MSTTGESEDRAPNRSWLLAIIVLLACMAALAGWIVLTARQRELLSVHKEFLKALAEEDYGRAYARMSANYKSRHNLAEFISELSRFTDDSEFETRWEVSGGFCEATVYQRNSEGWIVCFVYEYVLENGEWRFTGEGDYMRD